MACCCCGVFDEVTDEVADEVGAWSGSRVDIIGMSVRLDVK
jgi:hypothetical protein